jgi:hypothetical protein
MDTSNRHCRACLGGNVRRERLRRGLSLAELSAKSGLTVERIQEFEDCARVGLHDMGTQQHPLRTAEGGAS